MNDIIKNDEDLSKIEVVPSTPPDFRTHSNYVSFMEDLSEGLKIALNFNIDTKSKFPKTILSKKLKFIKMIKDNLDDEHRKAIQEREFAKLCSMWIPVKSYYLMFNLLLVLCALINNEEENLNYSHQKSIANFRKMIKDGKISFNKPSFNQIHGCMEIKNFKVKMGTNLKLEVEEELRTKEILKKLFIYKFESYCREEKIKNFKRKKEREKRDWFLKNNEISLSEFFYWYRIKSNYRDLAFLDQDVYSGEIAQFYESYYQFTINFYSALKDLINESSKRRFGEEVI